VVGAAVGVLPIILFPLFVRVRGQPPARTTSSAGADNFGAPKGTSLENLFATAKQGVLGVLFVMANDAHAPKHWKSWVLVVFHMLQVRGQWWPLLLLWWPL